MFARTESPKKSPKSPPAQVRRLSNKYNISMVDVIKERLKRDARVKENARKARIAQGNQDSQIADESDAIDNSIFEHYNQEGVDDGDDGLDNIAREELSDALDAQDDGEAFDMWKKKYGIEDLPINSTLSVEK